VSAEARVDLIWMNSMHTREEIAEVCRRVPGPVLCSYYGRPPTPTIDEWRELGVAVAIFPASAASAAAQASWEFLCQLKAEGPAALDAIRERTAGSPWGTPDRDVLLGEQAVKDLEASYLPADIQRDYEGTFGHKSTLEST